jgi:hypothetical protein
MSMRRARQHDVRLTGAWVDTRQRTLPSFIDITAEVGDEEKDAVSHFGLAGGDFAAMRNGQIIVFPPARDKLCWRGLLLWAAL